MKKGLLFLFLCLIPLIGFSQSTFIRGIKVGTTNKAVTIDSISEYNNTFRMYKGGTRITEADVINDTIEARIAAGVDLETYVDGRLDNFEGGGAIGMYELRGIVGTTSGFPTNGDSLIINSGFVLHPHITVYREGALQWMNTSNANAPDGYKFTASTGTITFKPVLSIGEQVVVHAFDPIVWNTLTPEGGAGAGGGSGESNLLTDLVAFYQFDETTGTLFNDELNTYDLTGTSITNDQVGKFGVAVALNASTDVLSGGSTGLELDSLSISVWVKTTGTPGDTRVIVSKRVISPNRGWSLVEGTGGDLGFYLYHSTWGYGALFSDATINDNLWHNIVCTYDGANIRMYIDGVEDNFSPQPWTHFSDYAVGATPFYVGNSYYNTDAFIGTIDALGIWHHVLREGTNGVNQVTDLQTKTNPFN